MPDRLWVGEDRDELPRHHLAHPAQLGVIGIHEHDVCAKTECDAGGVLPHHPRADDEDVAGLDARDAAEQHAAPAGRPFEVLRALLRREAARDLAAGHEQGADACAVGARRGQRFVGDRGDPAAERRLGEGLVGGEVERAEHDLARAHAAELFGLRLFDLDDHLGVVPDLVGGVDDRRARGGVVVVGQVRPDACAGLDADLVAARGEHLDAGGAHADAVFVRGAFCGDADAHGGLYPGRGCAPRGWAVADQQKGGFVGEARSDWTGSVGI